MIGRTLVLVADRETLELKEALDPAQHCYALSRNDLCGGCDHCLLMQAEHCDALVIARPGSELWHVINDRALETGLVGWGG